MEKSFKYFIATNHPLLSINLIQYKMKKLFLLLFTTASFAWPGNSGNSNGNQGNNDNGNGNQNGNGNGGNGNHYGWENDEDLPAAPIDALIAVGVCLGIGYAGWKLGERDFKQK